MNPELRERLRKETAEARSRQTPPHVDSSAAREPAEPGQIGHVYVLPESGGHPVEWAVLEVTSLRERLAVPLDDQPLVGSTDIAVPGGARAEPGLRAPSVLRCAHALDLDRRMLAVDHETGYLPGEVVNRARDLCRRISSQGSSETRGEALGTAIGLEVETEPEYRRWIEDVVIPAREAVRDATARVIAEKSEEPAASAVSESAASTAPRPDAVLTRSRRRGTALWALAAAALLALCLGLGWQTLRLKEERGTFLAEIEALQAPAEELQRQYDELTERLAQVEQDRDELRERLGSEATAVGDAIEALVNVPLAVLVSGVRGEPEVVEVAGDAKWIALAIELEPRPKPSYRLELKPFQGDQTLLRRAGLEPSRGLLSILLPAELMPPAAYRLSLTPEAGGQGANFTLIVERP